MMKQYNFDEIIPREGTAAYKTDLLASRFGAADLLPLWVADMDFRTPDFVMDAVRRRCEHEILGYTIRPCEFYHSFVQWLHRKHRWDIDRRWAEFIPGIVPALALAVLAYTEPGEGVIVQTPVYPPFMSVVRDNGRRLVVNQLLMHNGQYRMNMDELRRQAADPETKLFLLCSPHNPGGRVWTREELNEVSEICAANGVVVVSDEIHADLALPGFEHIPFATLGETAAQNSLTLMAPSKTFNIAGLGSSFYVAPNRTLFDGFTRRLQALEVGSGNLFAFAATQAAYNNGDHWLQQLTEYLQGNVELVDNYLKENIPQLKAIIPQASFLVWIDFSGLGLTDDQTEALLIRKAKLALNPGRSFGPGGSGYHRLNIGCSRALLRQALEQLKRAIEA